MSLVGLIVLRMTTHVQVKQAAAPGSGPEPQPVGRLLPGVVAQIVTRAAGTDFERWRGQVAATRYCSRPVRLVGSSSRVSTATGEVLSSFTTGTEPDGVLLKACGNRRATRCRSCAEVYRSDTWQLVAAGLRGGKGVPEQVAGHPRLFVTLTAPSFGAVHGRRVDAAGQPRVCRPRSGSCRHGARLGCAIRHEPGDVALGSPLCAECFDYQRAVLWNAVAPELWRRTTVYLTRAFGREVGVNRARLAELSRLSFTKVAEYQARGLVHFHAVLRLDGPDGPPSPPPADVDATVLARLVLATVPTVRAPLPALDGRSPELAGWGEQLDVRTIRTDGDSDDPTAIAAYVAKYATKSSTELGHDLDGRLRSAEQVAALRVPEHVRQLVSTCWDLGGRPELAGLQLRRWAHMLGFRGHFSTRSRRYSTTLTVLRAARADFQRSRGLADDDQGEDDDLPDTDQDLPPDTVEVISRWQFAGTGYSCRGDAVLARTAATNYWSGFAEARLEKRTRLCMAGS